MGIGKGFEFKLLLRKNGFDSNEIREVVYFETPLKDKTKLKNDRELPEPIKIEVDLKGIKYEIYFLSCLE